MMNSNPVYLAAVFRIMDTLATLLLSASEISYQHNYHQPKLASKSSSVLVG